MDRRSAKAYLALVRHGGEATTVEEPLLLAGPDRAPMTWGVELRWQVLDADVLNQSGTLNVLAPATAREAHEAETARINARLDEMRTTLRKAGERPSEGPESG